MVRCHVQGCERKESENKKHSFFSQPKSPTRCKIWREFAGVKNDTKTFRICSDHFDPVFYKKNKASVQGPKDMLRPLLYKHAVPTIKKSSKSPKRLRKKLSNPPTPNIDPPSESTMQIQNKENNMQIRRPAIQGECSHQNRGIILEVKKATDTESASVRIETNSAINVIITSKKCFCQH